MMTDGNRITERLFALQDLTYKQFQCKLIPTVNPDTVIGVRTPELRRLAKELNNSGEGTVFMKQLPHRYYEENNLHGALIEIIKDYDQCIAALNDFLPYVDNWATCDLISPKIFKKHVPELLEQIKAWMTSEYIYTVRFGIGMLMRFYLDEYFRPEYLEMVAAIHSEEYYINMMIAWFFATALAKQYEMTLPFIREQKLEAWIHNKTIQKAVESYRITDQQKVYLKGLKIKGA